ncbi:MAG: glycosyltransferase [Nitrospiraceae bacterium]|nr:glycosyltransferase [Nitrospiraceae bacterium]
MRIALINSPSLTHRPVSRSMAGGLGFDGNEAMMLPPLDLAIMAATLRDAGHIVELIDADPLRLAPAQIVTRLGQQTWDIIIATVSLPTLDQDAEFLAGLRSHIPAAKIAAKTLIRDQRILQHVLARSGAHLVIHGEVDLTITAIADGRTRSGTAWLEADVSGRESVLHFEEGAPVEDLNTLPFPARELLPNDRYVYPLLEAPVATLQTSRGCPFPCGYYCPYPLVEGVKWRSQTPERIFAELQDVVERHHITSIYFRDATFTLNQARIARLCDLIIEAGWTIQWMCETRIDCLSDALLHSMRRAGCVGLLVGVETGDERVMHLPDGKKGVTIPKIAHLREVTRQLGIRLHFLLIVGLPEETRESIVATYDLIQRYRPDTIGVTIITPYPGTPLHEQGIREGWIDSNEWRDYGGHQIPMHTPNLTRADMETGKRFLDEGFALLQRRQIGGYSAPLEALAKHHYERLLRWAYQLDQPIQSLHTIAASGAVAAPSIASPVADNRTSQSAIPAASSAMRLSILMPTYNRRAILRKTLLAFACQTVPPDQFEVLVVDDGSSDDTVQMLERFKAPFTLRIFTQPHQGANAARNLAIGQARGELLLITGDDMIPEPGFVEAHLKFHDQHPSEWDAMLGFIDWSPEITVTPFMRYIVAPEGGQQFSFHVATDGKADFRLFYTSNISLKRSTVVRQSTWFDTDFTYPAYDDTELGYRLAKQGLQIHYNAKAITNHHHPMTPATFVERQRKAGHMAMVIASKHPELIQPLGLNIDGLTASKDLYTEPRLKALLAVLAELEKPDLRALSQIQVNGAGYDSFYTRSVLYPLYQSVLHSAYALGVCEAAAKSQSKPGRNAAPVRTYVVSIVIPVWNKMELTIQCLSKLAEATEGMDYEVIVIDNHSTDGTPEFLNRLGGDIRIIRNQENLGFAKACNQGARMARGQYLVFLNNDTIPMTGWLNALVAEAEAHAEVGIVGSKLLYPDGTIQHAGVAFHRSGLGPYHAYCQAPSDLPAVNRRRELQAVTGACLLIRRSLFEELGGFHEGFQNGFEDVDLCLRARQQGHLVIYQPSSVLYHLESQTPGRKLHDEDNARLLRERWSEQWWIADEDAIYYADGYKLITTSEGPMVKQHAVPFTDQTERAAWSHAAAAQAAGLRQDWNRMRQELAAVHEWPDNPQILAWAALLCERLGEPAQGAAYLRRCVTLTNDPTMRITLARHLVAQGDLDAAEEEIERLLAGQPAHAEGLLVRGILFIQREQYEEAEGVVASALIHGADRKRCLMAMGMASLGRADAHQAWERFHAVWSEDPDAAEAIHGLLQAGTAHHRWPELSQILSQYILRNPGALSIRYALAGVLLRAGQVTEARRECNVLQTLDPAFDGLAELEQAITKQEAGAPMETAHR